MFGDDGHQGFFVEGPFGAFGTQSVHYVCKQSFHGQALYHRGMARRFSGYNGETVCRGRCAGRVQDAKEDCVDVAFARKLCALNSGFYRMQAKSFSGTRHAAWPGWRRCMDEVTAAGCLSGPDGVIVDVACGNLRFEQFAAQTLPHCRLVCHAVDDCDELALDQGILHDGAPEVRFCHLDVVGALLDGALDLRGCCGFTQGASEGHGADLAVAFGFAHHIPGAGNRTRFLDALMDTVRPGGFAAVSLWCFMRDEGLAQRARATHTQACGELGFDPAAFEAGDYLLGWNNAPGAWRYCHSFDDAEIEGLAASVATRARLAARFAADGRTGDLNEYLVFQVR